MPLFKRTAEWPCLTELMFPVKVNVPVGASYSSALVRTLVLASSPPVTSTCPSGSRLAPNSSRVESMGPVAANDCEAGSYSSALDRGLALVSCPPVIKTFPLGSRNALANARAEFIAADTL